MDTNQSLPQLDGNATDLESTEEDSDLHNSANPIDGLDSWLRQIRNEIDPAVSSSSVSQSTGGQNGTAALSSASNGDISDTQIPTDLTAGSTAENARSASLNTTLDSNWARDEELYGVSPSAFLYAVQEPCVFMERVINIAGATVIMDPDADEVRAAIICSSHLNVFPDPEFCTGDMVTCILNTKKYGEIYIVSLYCDIEKDPIPPKFRALRNKARREGKQLLLLGDLNAHSYACWNSKSTNARGRAWEKFVVDKGLQVLNKGNKFTFIAPTGQSIIDVCMATPKIADLVRHFATIDHVPSSDHVLNEFMLLTDNCWTPRPPGYIYADCQVNWDGFQKAMENSPSKVQGNIWTPADLDIEGPDIEDSIHRAMRSNAPEAPTITRIYPIDWWTKHISKLQARLKQIRQYIRKWAYKRLYRNLPDTTANKMKYTFADLREARRNFKKACRKAKRKHWRQSVFNIDSAKQTAGFNKKLNREQNAEIGLFTKPSGERCNIQETLDLLKDTHFPGNVSDEPPQLSPLAASVDITDPRADFITPERLKACIFSFKPGKGAGPDGLKPKVYQRLGPKALQRLANLYKASYLLGIQPSNFKLVRVIFIPKPGRPDYSVAKAHRPISLMNFVMKIMEKFLLWHHEDTILKFNPLESEQHGFTKAKSCDSAITSIVSRVEHSFKKSEYSVLALLDVEGAFDHATYPSMLDPIKAKGAPIQFISWIQDFLQGRKSTIHVKGVHREIYHTREHLRGGAPARTSGHAS